MTEYLICRSCDCASLQKMSIAHVFSLRVLHWYKSPACLMRLITYLSSAGGTRTDLILAGRDMLQFLLVATWGQSFVTSLMPLLTKYLLFPSTSNFPRYKQFGYARWGTFSGGRTYLLFGSAEAMKTFCEVKLAILLSQYLDLSLSNDCWWTCKPASKS